MTTSEAIAGFNPRTTSFSLANARAMAEMSKLAYDHTPESLENGLIVRDARDIRAVVIRTDDAVIVAFRGTRPDQLADWMTDADVIQQSLAAWLPSPDCGRVHRGFFAGMMLLFDQLCADIAALQTDKQPLFVTGHSLGGALAVCFAAAVTFSKGGPVNGVYTFGQPRVGDHTFCRACDHAFGDQHFRFVNNEDIVPRSAPRIIVAPPMWYEHSGQVRYFDSEGVMHDDEHWWNEFLIRFDVGENFLSMLRLPVADHDLQNGYISNLDKAIAATATTP